MHLRSVIVGKWTKIKITFSKNSGTYYSLSNIRFKIAWRHLADKRFAYEKNEDNPNRLHNAGIGWLKAAFKIICLRGGGVIT